MSGGQINVCFGTTLSPSVIHGDLFQETRYCGTACQQKDWPVHKKSCRERRRTIPNAVLHGSTRAAAATVAVMMLERNPQR